MCGVVCSPFHRQQGGMGLTGRSQVIEEALSGNSFFVKAPQRVDRRG